ncbi:MAG: GNAT family N-acetyltransferase [Candidatus Diapherotrites archaeon]|nr:GNAT family N-acetyltransferase [Candidatus Diapherotrites archaeon]
MNIREAGHADALAIGRIAGKSGYAVPELEHDEESIRKMLHDSMLVFLAEENGEAVGYIALDPKAPEKIEVHSIEVKKEHQGKGIGAALLDVAMAKALELGKKELVLFCHPRSKEAMAFYTTLGFERKGFVPGHYSSGEPAILFSKGIN